MTLADAIAAARALADDLDAHGAGSEYDLRLGWRPWLAPIVPASEGHDA